MAAAGIEPSDGVAYPSRRVAKAVEDAFGVLPMLACFEGDLLELWLCVGLDLKVGGWLAGWLAGCSGCWRNGPVQSVWCSVSSAVFWGSASMQRINFRGGRKRAEWWRGVRGGQQGRAAWRTSLLPPWWYACKCQTG